MKKLFFLGLTLLLIFALNSYAQPRTNREEFKFTDSSEVISVATGWSYNHTLGKWIDYKNYISNDNYYKSKNIEPGTNELSYADQNFISIQTKVLFYKNTKYFILIVKKWTGSYKYPEIREDWEKYIMYEAYIYNENEFLKLKNLKGLTSIVTTKKESFATRYYDYSEAELIGRIIKEIDTKNTYKQEIKFNILVADDGMIRFHLPYSPVLLLKTYDFDQMYFEIGSSDFNKIII